jgi:translocation and assembly module TamA
LSIKDPKKATINIPPPRSLKAQTNGKAQIFKVIDDMRNIEKWAEKNNCLFKYAISHKAIINHSSHTIDIIYQIIYKAKATYGDIKFSGLKTIDELYLNSLLAIKKGECFQYSSLNNAKLKLRQSNLLDKIETILPETLSPDGSVPVNFVVTERPPRTIKMGVNYNTDIGIGAAAGWEHRNILSHGEKISTRISFAEILQEIDVELEKPFFIRSDQKLKIASSIKKEDNEAYKSKGIDISGAVELEYSNKWIIGVGTKYAFEHIIDQSNDEKTMLLSTPLFASQDKRDDVFDPQKGWTLYFNTTPTFDTVDIGTSFIKNSVNGSYYKSISESNKLVLALRAGLGSIIGASSNTIPATERFYGGGSGSVRGYGYQLASPLDKESKPIGGRSLFTSSAELRFHVSDNYGLVPFIDCGKSFVNKFPDSKDSLLCGAGMGFRYYTSFGPLRIDFAAPLHKRPGVDDRFQLYFSIGQAF